MIKQLYTLIIIICFSNSLSGQSFRQLNTTLPCIEQHFSISVKIFTDSLGQTTVTRQEIEDAIVNTSSLFEEICLGFSICDFEILPNYKFDTLGVDRELLEIQSKFNKDHHINMYVVSRIGDQPFLDWGLTTFEGINLYTEGAIVVEKDNFQRTLTHELGHFFGLRNTFDTGNELVDGSNCLNGGDRICDTPADPYRLGTQAQTYLNENCEFVTNSTLIDSNGDYYLPDVCNVMSQYNDEDCLTGLTFQFSTEQYRHMAETYLNGPKQMW